jgi:tetratricopeptide (TPR) repeat protein
MKRNISLTLRCLAICGALTILSLAVSATALAQPSSQAKPSPTPRRALPKPVVARGFEKFAKRDASVRLIAAGGTRGRSGDSYEKGASHFKAGKYKAAVKELRESIKLSPDWDDPHYVLALTLTEMGDLKGAIEEFKRVIELALKDEPKILSYYNMGNAFADLGEYNDAVEAYKQAIKLDPTLSKPHNNLGLALAALDRTAEAANEFNIAVKLLPDYAEAHFNLGVVCVQLGKKCDAEEQHRTLAKLRPDLAAKLDALIRK